MLPGLASIEITILLSILAIQRPEGRGSEGNEGGGVEARERRRGE